MLDGDGRGAEQIVCLHERRELALGGIIEPRQSEVRLKPPTFGIHLPCRRLMIAASTVSQMNTSLKA